MHWTRQACMVSVWYYGEPPPVLRHRAPCATAFRTAFWTAHFLSSLQDSKPRPRMATSRSSSTVGSSNSVCLAFAVSTQGVCSGQLLGGGCTTCVRHRRNSPEGLFRFCCFRVCCVCSLCCVVLLHLVGLGWVWLLRWCWGTRVSWQRSPLQREPSCVHPCCCVVFSCVCW